MGSVVHLSEGEAGSQERTCPPVAGFPAQMQEQFLTLPLQIIYNTIAQLHRAPESGKLQLRRKTGHKRGSPWVA